MENENQIKQKLVVVSFFDGIAIGLNSLKAVLKKYNLHDKYEIEYHSIENDKKCILVAKHNHPEIIFHGDIKSVKLEDLPKNPFLVLNSSPCQSITSMASPEYRTGLDSTKNDKSSLFHNAANLINALNYKYLVSENVNSMQNVNKLIFTETLKVGEPILLQSEHFSPSIRNRLYWTNIPNVKVVYNNINKSTLSFQDILVNGYAYKKTYKANVLLTNHVTETIVGLQRFLFGPGWKKALKVPKKGIQQIVLKDKFVADMEPLDVIEYYKKHSIENGKKESSLDFKNGIFRVPCPEESEAMMGIPVGYTNVEGNSTTNRHHQCGNSYNQPTIEFILSNIPEFKEHGNTNN